MPGGFKTPGDWSRKQEEATVAICHTAGANPGALRLEDKRKSEGRLLDSLPGSVVVEFQEVPLGPVFLDKVSYLRHSGAATQVCASPQTGPIQINHQSRKVTTDLSLGRFLEVYFQLRVPLAK